MRPSSFWRAKIGAALRLLYGVRYTICARSGDPRDALMRLGMREETTLEPRNAMRAPRGLRHPRAASRTPRTGGHRRVSAICAAPKASWRISRPFRVLAKAAAKIQDAPSSRSSPDEPDRLPMSSVRHQTRVETAVSGCGARQCGDCVIVWNRLQQGNFSNVVQWAIRLLMALLAAASVELRRSTPITRNPLLGRRPRLLDGLMGKQRRSRCRRIRQKHRAPHFYCSSGRLFARVLTACR